MLWLKTWSPILTLTTLKLDLLKLRWIYVIHKIKSVFNLKKFDKFNERWNEISKGTEQNWITKEHPQWFDQM